MKAYADGTKDPKENEGQEIDKEFDKKKDENAQHNEASKSVTPTHPDVKPHDTTRDAKDRWDTESPAVKGQPNRIDPEQINEDIYPESDVDVTNEELDEEDPDAEKNIK